MDSTEDRSSEPASPFRAPGGRRLGGGLILTVLLLAAMGAWAAPGPGETQTYSDFTTMLPGNYEIPGGITTFQDVLGSPSGILLRGDGGTIQLQNSASAGTANILVDGGMGNGGLPGHLVFRGNSTAGAASVTNRPGNLGPNFKNELPNPVDGWGGETRFYDLATAGTAYFENEPEKDAGASSSVGGHTEFAGQASADHATFITRGASIVNGAGGRVDFAENATAGHGTFVNYNSENSSDYSQGRTVFFDSATAGEGTFTNLGASGGFLAVGGTTEFRGTSSAGKAIIINQGPAAGSFPQGGKTQFFDTATAGTAVITNKAGAGAGGMVEFKGHSTAGAGQFINDGSSPTSANGGDVVFKEDSVAGQASFHTTGLYGGNVNFNDRASADHGIFLIDSGTANSRIVFYGSSTAGNGDFEIGGGGYLQFFESSTASNATILLHGDSAASSLGGFSASAGNAMITVMGAEVPGSVGGNLSFQAPGTAGNASITVNGASVTTFGASGGLARFDYSSSAGTASFVINGGSNGGLGGRLEFARGATADQASIVVNAGGTLDVAGNVYYNGTQVGALAGGGSIYLGAAALSAGGLNTDTTISGVISDTGVAPYGTFTKTGTGKLTLSGANAYKGLTTVAAGTLAINGSVAGPVQVNTGATLKGTGSIGGSVTVAPGGTVAPGNSPGTLTIGGDYTQAPQGMLEIEVAGPNPQDRDHLVVNGNADLSGTLLLVFSGYAPSAAESYSIVEATGHLNVGNLNVVVLGLQPGFEPGYQVSSGQLILTASSNGQLRGASDPVQVLQPWYTKDAGFMLPVFALAGLTYDLETSTDLKTWTRLSEKTGTNAMLQFRDSPSVADAFRFYRVGYRSANP